ncbi:MAG: SMC-Scp complex subunit ScpB [Clostridia bacterium]|nr:SMC-Scp complex subunit ScpB [Clostridia bacterium]
MEIKKIESAIEGILFASGKPISEEKIALALELDIKTFKSIISKFMSDYNSEEKGLKIIKINDDYQLCTRSEYSEYIKRALDNRKNFGLSAAAMEILAITAYNQPVTRAYVEQIRGVDCTGIMANLIEKGLLEKKGHLDVPGKPSLYFVTSEFFRCFNISSLSELPKIDDSDIKNAIKENEEAQIKLDIPEENQNQAVE